MNRYFVGLLFLWLVLYCITAALGMQLPEEREALVLTQRHAVRVHLLLGVLTAVWGMMVHGIVITYFVGTSRWCREVTETYRFDPNWAQESQRLKRRTFPLTLLGMLSLVGLVALGAASDPTSRMPPLQWGRLRWSDLHFGAAVAVLMLQLVVAYVQWANILENQKVIRQLVQQVQTVRKAKGLED